MPRSKKVMKKQNNQPVPVSVKKMERELVDMIDKNKIAVGLGDMTISFDLPNGSGNILDALGIKTRTIFSFGDVRIGIDVKD